MSSTFRPPTSAALSEVSSSSRSSLSLVGAQSPARVVLLALPRPGERSGSEGRSGGKPSAFVVSARQWTDNVRRFVGCLLSISATTITSRNTEARLLT